ncbi:unnamed protein product [Gongylonema pulchrum]|uniref:Uncharacterized protein n=1 Tax=Gongylonema pulchrum TaxID=637853 RepID=A0A183DAB5_9BILA|nr:unnamed protein product [Gongylonema pulchrum]
MSSFAPVVNSGSGNPAAATATDLTCLMFSGFQQMAAANYMHELRRMITMENLTQHYSGIWPGVGPAATTTPFAGAGSWPDAQHMLGSVISNSSAITVGTASTTDASSTTGPLGNLTNSKESPTKKST